MQRGKRKAKERVEDTTRDGGVAGGFGERLARLRKSSGFTQVEFAQQMGATQRMVTYWESEGGRPPGHLLPRMADVLGVSIDALLGQEKIKAAPPQYSRFWRKLREVEKLPEADRKAVLRFVDALLAKQKFESQG